jgi:hypothetical protein
MRKAKKQAQMLPRILASGPYSAYAHVAYFDRGAWKARLDDPPPLRRGTPTSDAILAAYYAPLRTALIERNAVREFFDDVEFLIASLPEVHLMVGLRSDLADAAAGSPAEAGRKLRILLSERRRTIDGAASAEERYSPVRARLTARQDVEKRRSLGTDGVLVLTGEAWDEAAMSLGPEQRPSILEMP